jgi:ABC-type multidrug transport system fused ATPase/permease subunit
MPDQLSRHWRATAGLIWPNRLRYGALTLAVVASNALVLAGPIILRSLIDAAAAGAQRGHLTWLAVAFLVVAVLAQAIALLVSWLATSSAWRTANDLRLRLAEHVLRLDHGFHRSHRPGELIQRIDGDVTSVSDFLSTVVVRVLSGLVLVVGVVIVISTIDWRLGVGMAVYCLVAAFLIYVQRDRSIAEAAREMSASARLYGGIEERLTASEDLRANGAGDWALWRFVEDSIGHVDAVVAREKAFLGMWRNLQVSIVLGAGLSLVVGAIGVERGFLTVGTAFLLFQYSQRIRRPLEDILDELEIVQKANGAMSRVAHLEAQRPEILDAGAAGRAPPPGPLTVTFDTVSFAYGDDEPVLNDITFEVAAARSVGVVGHTGGGKTTLSRLLGRLVEPRRGTIRLGGVSLQEIPLAELRSRVALVPQTVELIQGTIRDNVTLFDPAHSDADVGRALEQVGLDRYGGQAMHRPLGSAGAGLSAGEAQLLALARVWLRQPDLVVLDEPTARVDPETEALLERALETLFGGRSVFVIAHRLSTLRQMDEIMVIEHGRLVEHGERQLLDGDRGSRYQQLVTIGAGLGAG